MIHDRIDERIDERIDPGVARVRSGVCSYGGPHESTPCSEVRVAVID